MLNNKCVLHKGRIRKNLTLVELLAVILIISVLSGLLLPSLNRARSAARRNQCAGILKSFGQAAMLYAGNHADYWIPPQKPSWHAGLEFRRLIGMPDETENGHEAADETVPRKWLCPDSGAILYKRPFAYYSFGVTLDNLQNTGHYAFRLPRLRTPSGSAAWMDTIGAYANILNTYREEAANAAPDGRLAYRHGDALNAAFFDGHVQNLRRDAVKARWNKVEYRFNKYFTCD